MMRSAQKYERNIFLPLRKVIKNIHPINMMDYKYRMVEAVSRFRQDNIHIAISYAHTPKFNIFYCSISDTITPEFSEFTFCLPITLEDVRVRCGIDIIVDSSQNAIEVLYRVAALCYRLAERGHRMHKAFLEFQRERIRRKSRQYDA